MQARNHFRFLVLLCPEKKDLAFPIFQGEKNKIIIKKKELVLKKYLNTVFNSPRCFLVNLPAPLIQRCTRIEEEGTSLVCSQTDGMVGIEQSSLKWSWCKVTVIHMSPLINLNILLFLFLAILHTSSLFTCLQHA